MPSLEQVKQLQIPLRDISLATNGFSVQNRLAKGGFGTVYKGFSEEHGHIAIKRLDRRHGQGDREFKTEIALLRKHKHENIVSLLGFCDEEGEKILVYKYESNSSLDRHIDNKNLTWIQRLRICLDVAHGLKYLHDDVGPQHRILHRDVKSSNILLGANWKAKISDFGLSRIGPANTQSTFLISNPCGTRGYIDPEYGNTGYLTQKSDVYSFGVVLFEVLCERLACVMSYKDERRFLTVLVRKHYTKKTLDKIIPSELYKQINAASLLTFSNIAYQCLKNVEERPTMQHVVEQLQKALHYQEVETNPAAGDEKKGAESTNPPPQDIVLKVFMHCEDCARKVRRCLKGFEGVEDVVTDCETHKVIVKGKTADPLKVLKRVQKKCNRKVELLLPDPNPPTEKLEQEQSVTDPSTEVPKKPEQEQPVPDLPMEEPKKPEQEQPEKKKKDEQPMVVITVVLKVHMHCQACALKVKKCIKKMKGVESVDPDLEHSQVTVKGIFRAAEVVDHVYKETGKKGAILKQYP